MPDNLTLKFKEELEKRGIVATDAQIETFLSAQRQAPAQPPVNLGGSLYNNVNTGLPSWFEGTQAAQRPEEGTTLADVTRNLYEGLGMAAWQYGDVALFTIPSAILGTVGLDPVEKYKELLAVEGKELTGVGKVGEVIGQAAGFLKPIKWVSKGTSAIVSKYVTKGGTKTIQRVVDKAADSIPADSKMTSGLFRSTLDKEFKTVATSKLLANYSLSPAAIKASQGQLKSNVGRALQDAFPEAATGLVDDMAERIVLNLGKDGRHINSTGQWIQRVLGRRLGLDEAGRVSKYVTHAGDMTVSFGLYNTMVNGVQAMAGNEDFDPAGNIYHALAFSAFLPFVEAIPGGGKIPIYKTQKDIRKLLNAYKNANYRDESKYSVGALNGLLKIITNNNSLKNKSYGVIAANNAWRDFGTDVLNRKQAVKILEEIKVTGGLDKVWSEFASAAGKDLAASIGRMAVGAFYFNSETLMNEQHIKGLDPEVLGAHLLVGAFFTKMRKPIFDKETPTLTDFQSKLELLNAMGIDATAAESWNSYYTNRQIMAAANGGVLSETRLKSVYDIIYNEKNQLYTSLDPSLEKADVEGRMGSDILDPEFNLLRFAKDVADIKRVSEAVHNSEPENIVMLENLTKTRARELIDKLKQVTIDKKTGELLTEENFDDFYVDLQKSMVENGANTIVRAVIESARKLGLIVESDADVSKSTDDILKVFDLDKQTIRIQDISGAGSRSFRELADNYEAIIDYQTLVTILKSGGYIGNIRAVEGKDASDIMKTEGIDGLHSEIEGLMRSMTDGLKKDNFPDGIEVEVLPTNNAWLTLLKRYRTQKDLVDVYNGIIGKNVIMYDSLKEIFGVDAEGKPLGMPNESVIRDLVLVSETKPEDIKQEDWDRIKATSLPDLQTKLQLIAKLWGKENRAATNKKVEIDYDDAVALVGAFEADNRSVFRNGFLDRFTTYHSGREFKDARLGVREAGIMSIAKEFSVADKSPELNNMWVFPDGAHLREYLRETEGYSEAEVSDLIIKYDRIKNALSRLDGKYIKFEDQVNLNAETRGDIGGFINSAYELTGVRQRDVIKEYDRVRDKGQEQAEMVQQTNAIINSMFDSEVNAMRKLTKDEAVKVIGEINKLLPNVNIPGREVTFKDKDLQKYMETLKSTMEKWVEASDATAEFSLTDSMYEGGLNIIDSRTNSLNKLRDTMQRLQDFGSSSNHRRLNSSRVKHELSASLVRKLKDMNIEISEEATLDEIYDKYNFERGDKNIENFIDEVNLKIVAEQRNLSAEQYDLMNEEIARNKSILSDSNSDPEKLTYEVIERKYGPYSDNLKDFIGARRSNIDKAIIAELDEPSPQLINEIEILIRDVHEAIDKKHDGDFIKSLAEKMEFNKELPGLLAFQFGTDVVPSISFSENGIIKGDNKVELLIENKIESEGGFSQFQKDWIGDGEAPIHIYKVARGSVYGGKTYEDFADIPEEILRKGGLFDKPASVIDRDNGQIFGPGFTGTRATVSYVDQIYIRTDNIVDNPAVAERFKRRFDDWYDKIESELDGASLSNFRKMFKEWKDAESLGLDPNVVRDLVKSMYWHHLMPEGFKDLVVSANNRNELNERGVSLLKYFNTMSTAGAKVRGSELFLRTINEVAMRQERDNQFWWEAYGDEWNDVRGAIQDYTQRGHWRVSSVADESVRGFGAKEIVKSALVKQAASFPEGSVMEKTISDLLDKIDAGDFASLESSSINAQTWLGTNAAHVAYLQKGRLITDSLAGVKPVGWSPSQDILLKTNFVYDKEIADILDAAGIDILTTESASKRFGAGSVDLQLREGEYGSYQEAFGASTEALTNAPKGALQIEDIYFGKMNERKMANVSYGMLDFLDKIGYHAFTKDYNDYYGKLDNQLGDLVKMQDSNDITRNEVFMSIHNIVRDNGEIFSDASSGSLSRLVQAGVDIQSVLTMGPAERMVVRRILGEIGKTKTEHGSYSVLIPYLEGSIPVYGKVEEIIDGRTVEIDKQLIFGGKKVSSYDGDIRIGDWNKVKYIAEWKDASGEGWDIQVGVKGNEIVVNDPYLGNEIGAVTRNGINKLLKEVRDGLDGHLGIGNSTYKDLFTILDRMGEIALPNGEKVKMNIHSLSLRIPSLAGDVAIHKIEGFLDRSLGNSTGINPFDLAVVHQADFDVDAVFNHHDMPIEVIESVTRNAAKTPDAHQYKSDEMNTLDIFNMGKEVNTVGKGSDSDSLEEYYNNFRNSQRIFGSIMNLAPGLSALKRLEFSFADGKMMDLESNTFIPVKQRMKNSLQSIIDATKRSNVVSRASTEEVMKFILFGRTFDGSESITKELHTYRELRDHEEGDTNWDGVFDLREYKGKTKEVMEDAIIETLNIVNSQNRMLTGVNDAAGRRPPDLNQMMYIKNRISDFLKNPNKTVFNNLLFKYRVLDRDRKSEYLPELVNLFYKTREGQSYADEKEFLKDLFKKGKKGQAVHMSRKPIISLRMEPKLEKEDPGHGRKNIHLTGVGGIIADKFGTKLNDKSRRLKHASATDTKFVHDFIDKFEAANMLASEESLIDVNEFARTVDSAGGTEMFGEYGDLFFSELARGAPNASIVQKYSVMYHVLDQRESSLRRFVRSNMGAKYKSNSVARAHYKLNLLGSAKDYFHKKEAELIDSVRPEDGPAALRGHFFFHDYDLRKRPSGYNHINRTNKTQYVYRVSEKGARVKYNYVASVAPLGSPKNDRFLKKGSEYVILKNPVRYELMSSKEVQDGYALFKVTGEALANNIEGIDPGMIDAFYDRLGALKSEFYELNNETFKLVKQSAAFAQRNWMDAKEHEDRLIREFFHGKEDRGGVLDGTSQSHDALFTIASLIIKPMPTTAQVKLSAGEKFITFPAVKINRRLVLAVERYLHSRANEAGIQDVYDSIFGEYGRHYRRAVNKIAHPTEESMYRSDMYMNGPLHADRNPLLDFVYDKPGFLYMPNVLQRVQKPLRRYGGRSYRTVDMHGNVRRVVNYEDVAPLETLHEYYSSEKNFEDTINSREVCQ